ncbi:MAG: segregation/condensation protein A [Pirellulaceae bacterium]
MNFRIEIDEFRGPIDLLLYLVRKSEIDVSDISLAKIIDQYLEYIEILKELSIDSVGDFLNVASRLVEIKSKNLLPQTETLDDAETYADPREDLVHRLLLYKQFRDAASALEDRAADWQERFPRIQDDLPPRKLDLADQPLRSIELWDLVSAFGRVLREKRRATPEKVVYDDTPLTVYMQRIHGQLCDQRKLYFSDLFQPGMHKSAMIGVFLAVLELTRHHNVRADQDDEVNDIVIIPGEGFKHELHLNAVDDYNPHVQGISSDNPDSFNA